MMGISRERHEMFREMIYSGDASRGWPGSCSVRGVKPVVIYVAGGFGLQWARKILSRDSAHMFILCIHLCCICRGG